MTSYKELYERVTLKLFDTGQSQILKFCKDEEFLNEIDQFDFAKIRKDFENARNYEKHIYSLLSTVQPILTHADYWKEQETHLNTIEKFRRMGLNEIANGSVGALVLSQDYISKDDAITTTGVYSPDLLSRKSLYQLQAERIITLQELSKEISLGINVIPWYVMINMRTGELIKNFFEANNYFGLSKNNVIFVNQQVIPAYTMDGKILLSEKCHMSTKNDGSGGLFKALEKASIITDMQKRLLTHIFVYNVDNLLVKVADPVFIGFCLSTDSDCGVKVVPRQRVSDADDLVCMCEEQITILEHRDIPQKFFQAKNSSGNLIYSIIYSHMQVLSVKFLERIVTQQLDDIPFHAVKAKLPHINSHGVKHIPDSPNAYYIKKCIFDAFHFADKMTLWQVSKSTDYSPLNMPLGNPIAVSDLYRLHKKYIENAGGRVKSVKVEISPLVSYGGEKLKQRVLGKVFLVEEHIMDNAEAEKKLSEATSSIDPIKSLTKKADESKSKVESNIERINREISESMEKDFLRRKTDIFDQTTKSETRVNSTILNYSSASKTEDQKEKNAKHMSSLEPTMKNRSDEKLTSIESTSKDQKKKIAKQTSSSLFKVEEETALKNESNIEKLNKDNFEKQKMDNESKDKIAKSDIKLNKVYSAEKTEQKLDNTTNSSTKNIKAKKATSSLKTEKESGSKKTSSNETVASAKIKSNKSLTVLNESSIEAIKSKTNIKKNRKQKNLE